MFYCICLSYLTSLFGVIFAGGLLAGQPWFEDTAHFVMLSGKEAKLQGYDDIIRNEDYYDILMCDTSAKSTFPGIQLPKFPPQEK